MEQPMDTEELTFGDSVRKTEEPIQHPYPVGDVIVSPVDAQSADYNNIATLNPESCLQKYWLQDGFSEESKTVKPKGEETLNDKEIHLTQVTKPLLKEQTLPKGIVGGSTSNNAISVNLEDKMSGGADVGGVKKEVHGSSLLQRRGRGRPRKANTMNATHSNAAQAVRSNSRGEGGKRLTRSAAKALSLSGQMAYEREAVTTQKQRQSQRQKSVDEIFATWSKNSETAHAKKKLKIGSTTSKSATVPKKRGRPPTRTGSAAGTGEQDSQGDQSRGKKRQATKSVKPSVPVQAMNTPQKRGRPRIHPVVELPAKELCTPCYLKASLKFGKTLYNQVLRLEAVGSVLPAERDVGKRARGRPRKVRETHPVQLCPKEEPVGMEPGSSNLEATMFNSASKASV